MATEYTFNADDAVEALEVIQAAVKWFNRVQTGSIPREFMTRDDIVKFDILGGVFCDLRKEMANVA